jgi:hypothetical protein
MDVFAATAVLGRFPKYCQNIPYFLAVVFFVRCGWGLMWFFLQLRKRRGRRMVGRAFSALFRKVVGLMKNIEAKRLLQQASCGPKRGLGILPVALPVAMLVAMLGNGVARAADTPAPAVKTPGEGVPDPAKAAALAVRIRTLLLGMKGASVAAITARLQAEVGAAGGNCGTSRAALVQVARDGLAPAAVSALNAMASSADLCAATGTGAITRAETLQQSTTLGLPGGSSNYQ